MPILPFDSRQGYSVGATAVVDSLRNINAVGGTFTARVSMAGGVTASQLFVGGTITAGTVSATTYRNLPQASASVTGVASFGNEFVVSAAGAVSLTGNYVRSFNGSTGSVFYAPPVATESVTGVASFVNTFFKVSSGAVSLADAYAATGDTVVAGTNVGVSRSGRTVTVSSTHPLASASATGVASFGNEFVVSAAGAVSLTGNYVRSFNGSTGAVTYSPRLATSALTGVASFNDVHFTVASTGHVLLASAYQVTGDTVVAGTNVGISRSGRTVTVSSTHPLASASVTGVASFNNQFVVSAAGAVGLTTNFVVSANSLTGAITITGGTGVAVDTIASTNRIVVSVKTSNFVNSTANIATYDTSTNSFIGVAGFNYDTSAGNLKIAGNLVLATPQANVTFPDGTTQSTAALIRLASGSQTGVASFGNEFIVSAAGAVSLTGNYVRSFNGSTGAVVYAPPLATTSITGVASFNTNDFTVTTGAVSLSNVARTNAANTFTSAQTFNAGITTQSAFVSQGLTVGGRAAFNSGITSANLFVGAGVTLNSSLYVGGNSTLGGGTANTITLPSGQVMKTYRAQTFSTSTYTLFTESMFAYSGADILIQAEKWGDGSVSSGLYNGTLGVHNTRISVVANPDGFGVNHVQYGSVFTGSTAASYDIDSDGAGGWRLRVTPNSTYVTTIRAQAILSPNLGGSGA